MSAMQTCSVRELIDYLETCDPDLPVVAGSYYGDRHHTTQAVPLGVHDNALMVSSLYSDSGYKLISEEEYEAPENSDETIEAEPISVLMLNYELLE